MAKKNILSLLSIIFVASILLFGMSGCGYKAPPKYVESNN